jgi:hypothetical protein
VTWPTRAGIATATALAVWLAGYAIGRTHAPPAEVTTKTVEKLVYQDRVEYRDRVTVQAAKTQVIRRVIRVTVAPDGTTTRDVTVDKATNASQSAQAIAQGVQASSLAQSHAETVTVVQRAPWKLGLLLGMNAGAVTGADRRWWAGGTGSHGFVWGSRLGLAVVKKQGETPDIGIVGEVEW